MTLKRKKTKRSVANSLFSNEKIAKLFASKNLCLRREAPHEYFLLATVLMILYKNVAN